MLKDWYQYTAEVDGNHHKDIGKQKQPHGQYTQTLKTTSGYFKQRKIGLPSTVNKQSPPIVTCNSFASFSKDLSVTIAVKITQNQALAVITPTHQEQAQQPNQHQLKEEEKNNNNNDGDLSVNSINKKKPTTKTTTTT